MSIEDPDIVEIDFPPYVEEHSPFPDVETDFNFEENKEEIYSRNRIIAAENQAALIKEEERKRLEKQEQFRKMTEAAKAADKKRYWNKIVLLDSIIVIFGIIALIVALSGRNSNPSSYDLSNDDMWFELEVSRAEEQLKKNSEPEKSAALSDADDKAKNIHTAASACIAELIVTGVKIDGDHFENNGTVFVFDNTEKNMAELLGNSFSGYVYGGFNEETYIMEYTLWSAEPIPEEYRRKLTYSEQKVLADHGIIIGCYSSDGS